MWELGNVFVCGVILGGRKLHSQGQGYIVKANANAKVNANAITRGGRA